MFKFIKRESKKVLLNTIDCLEDEIKELIGAIYSGTSKVKLLKEMQKENEGYIASIKKILQDAETNKTLAGKFVNVVAK
jgi:hypothetical protein